MDIQLRGPINGIEAANHIQQSTGAPIVFLTAFASMFLQNPAQMQPPGLCLSKPYSKYQLEAVLQAVQPR
jgi:CheY-like chemotaxis protein